MISVCIATYNGEKYIKKQVDSILPQLTSEDIVVVSDDGSTDDTLKILAAYNDPRIRIFHNEGRHGVVGNFQNGLTNCHGDYIFLCDQDDIWQHDKVVVMTNLLRTYDLAVCNAKLIDADDNIINDSFFEMRGSRSGFWHNLRKNSYLGCCMAFRSDLLGMILPFPEKIAMHDIWIGLCCEMYGRTIFINETLTYYRRHDTNASPTGIEGSNFSYWYRISYRLRMLWELTKHRIDQIS